jgi:DMSO/TMAO reductase YedYZ molybdopterin-dependent catalytic subunit
MMERTPAELAVPLLTMLGPFAKPFATAGGLASLWLILTLLGMLIRQSRSRFGIRVRLLLALVAFVPIAYLLGASLDVAVASTVAGWGIALAAPVPGKEDSSRRDFGINVAGLAILASILSWPLAARALQPAKRVKIFDFIPPNPRDPSFAGLPISAEVTGVDDLYVMSKSVADPEPDSDLWRLRITGPGPRPAALTIDDLTKLGAENRFITLECISNPVGGPLMGNGLWTVAPLRRALEANGGVSAAAYRVSGIDGYSDVLPKSEIDGALLAWALNGERLDRRHGAPLRLLLPGRYGFRSVKWLASIEALPGIEPTTWERLGWSPEAVIRPTARIDYARRDGSAISAGGVALSPNSGVSAVEVRLEGGPWHRARLHTPALSKESWVQWWIRVPGDGSALEARLIDGADAEQDREVRGPFPSGASGYHRVTIA